ANRSDTAYGMANQGNVSPRRHHVSGEHFELFSRRTQPRRQPGRAESFAPKIATESLTASCSFRYVGPAMSQPIGKHRQIDLIMERCGSSISDIQGHGHAAHSPSATQPRGLKHESNGILR